MLKDITIGQYYKEDSLIHRLDPRVKLFAVLIYVITLFMHKAPATYVMSLLFLIITIKISKVPVKYILRGLKSNCSDLIILCNDQYVIYSRKTSDPVLDHINFCRRDQDNYLSGKPSDHAGIRNVFTDIYNNTK